MNVPDNKINSPGISPNFSINLAQPEKVLTNLIEICKSVNAK
jgi:hypothetical protein